MKTISVRTLVVTGLFLCAIGVTTPLFAAPLPPEPPPIAESPVGGPDLVFVYVPGYTTGKEMEIGDYVIENRGSQPAAPFSIEYRTDVGFVTEIPVAGLASGARTSSVVVAYNRNLFSCTALRIDPTNQVAETNEANNILANWGDDVCGRLSW